LFPLKPGVFAQITGFSALAKLPTTSSISSPIISPVHPERTTNKSASITLSAFSIVERSFAVPPKTTSFSLIDVHGKMLGLYRPLFQLLSFSFAAHPGPECKTGIAPGIA
jgi:hypothetical protein